MKYYQVILETQNPSADDYWNFKSKAKAEKYAAQKRKDVLLDKSYYGESTVEVFEQNFHLMDE